MMKPSIISSFSSQVQKYCRSATIFFRTKTSNHPNVTETVSPCQKTHILKKINNDPVNTLKELNVTSSSISNIEEHHGGHAPHKTLQDSLVTNGVEQSIWETLYKSPVDTIVKSTPPKKILRYITNPHITLEDRIHIKTILGLHVGANVVSWALANRDGHILFWDYRCTEHIRSTSDLFSTIEQIEKLYDTLPEADVYILEECKTGNLRSRKTVALFRQLITIASIYNLKRKIDAGIDKPLKNRIFMLKSKLAAKHFNLSLGDETISSHSVMQDIFRGAMNHGISINPDLTASFIKYDGAVRDQMSWSLILTATFVNLTL